MSNKPKFIKLSKSQIDGKKMTAIFYNNKKEKLKTTHFGSENMSDFTLHKDEDRKKRYMARHKKNENWKDPTTAGSLSRWILWNKPTKKESILDYLNRFNLKKI
jgi:hypothetical protein